MKSNYLLLMSLLLATTPLTAASYNKCVDKNGAVSYSNKPCPTNQSKQVVNVAPAPAYKAQPERADLELSAQQRAQCDAARRTIRGNAPIEPSELERLRTQIQVCVVAEFNATIKAMEAEDRAAAKAEEARIKAMSPACQSIRKELIALQTSMSEPAQIDDYIKMQRVYEQDCEKVGGTSRL
jgi:hypothetical protein